MKKTYVILLVMIFLFWCDKKIISNEKIETENISNGIIISKTETKNNQKKTQKEKKEDTIYTNKKEWFSIKIPSWRDIQENKYIWRVLLSAPLKKGDKIHENLIINTDSQSGQNTIEEYYNQQKKWIENHIKNYKEILKEDFKIAKLDWIKIIYQWTLWNYNLQRQQIIFLKNWKFFLITYTATQETFQEYIWQIDDIIKSLKF